MLRIKNLSFSYPEQSVLKKINLEIERGKTVSLLGESGSGKSTLLNCIAGFLVPSAGEVSLNDELLSSVSFHLPIEKRGISVVFQDYCLFPHLNVEENITFGLKGMAKKEMTKIADEYLDLIKLKGFNKRNIDQLSGGQKQRVGVARALAVRPKALLLDEPFSNLDANLRLQLASDIKEILKNKRISSLFITHDEVEANKLGDQTVQIKEGQIIL